MSSWDDPETAEYYEAFCLRHTRYIRANAELIEHAQLAPDMGVLDLAAGTGRTAEAALELLGDHGKMLCVEPHAGRRTEGMRRVADRRVEWSAVLPHATESFERILCGAAIWQLPLPETFGVLARLLRPGGALTFNIPALYLMEPDEPGGGSDPLLLSLPELLFETRDCAPVPAQSQAPLSSTCIDSWLHAAGFRAQSWSFRLRLTQDSYADWLKIPVLTDGMLGGLTPKARAQRIDAALESADRSSWKWERWRGWTAWKA
jgi:ubiquinone/menaquinone biosynthesis C-methylase UbiE